MFDVFDGYHLDYRLLFIAACSSFITLLLLNILDRYKSIPSTQYHEHESENIYPKQRIIEPLSASKQYLFSDMISEDLYVHTKSKTYFESDEYLNLIPNNREWHKSKLKLLIKGRYTESLHQTMLDHFDVKSFEPSTHPYLAEITTAMDRFNEWRRWPSSLQTTNASDGWRYRTTKNNMHVWTHALPDSPLEIVKAEKVFAIPIAVIVGVLMNPKHIHKMDPMLVHLEKVEMTSRSSTLIHICVNCPFPLKNRDFVNVAMLYMFKDGSILMGSTKANNDDLLRNDRDYVRATITLSMYHVRPHYDGDINRTKVTFYSHILLNGAIPQWMLNFAYMEIAKGLLKLEKYCKNNINKLHEKGELYVPPNPFLKMIDVI